MASWFSTAVGHFGDREHGRRLRPRHNEEFLRSLQIAHSELEETRWFKLLSHELGKISREDF